MEFPFNDSGLWGRNELESAVERLRREAVLRRARSMELSERVEALETENNEMRLVLNLLMQALRERGALHDADLSKISDALAQFQSSEPPAFARAEPEPVVEEVLSEDLAAAAAASKKNASELEFRSRRFANPTFSNRE